MLIFAFITNPEIPFPKGVYQNTFSWKICKNLGIENSLNTPQEYMLLIDIPDTGFHSAFGTSPSVPPMHFQVLWVASVFVESWELIFTVVDNIMLGTPFNPWCTKLSSEAFFFSVRNVGNCLYE